MATRTRIHPPMTAAQFAEIAALPENRHRRLELRGGKVVEVVSNSYSSEVAAALLGEIYAFNKIHKLGRVTGADGGYQIGDDRYIPDIAFVPLSRQPERSLEAYSSALPSLVVEVLSPGNDERDMRIKIANYLSLGITVWVVDPILFEVEVYAPGERVKVLRGDDVLDGGDVLPGFRLPIKDIFPQ